MLLHIFYFLPCLFSFLWFILFLRKKDKNYRQQLFCYAEGFSIIFYALIAIYTVPNIDYHTMVKLETIGIPLGFVFPVFLIAYTYYLYTQKRIPNRLITILFIPAIVEETAILILCYLLGFDRAVQVTMHFADFGELTGEFSGKLEHLYCIFTYYTMVITGTGYLITLFVLSLATLKKYGYRFGDIFRFFFRGKRTDRSKAIAIMVIFKGIFILPLILIGTVFISSNTCLGICLAICFAIAKLLLAYLEYFSNDPRPVSLHSLSRLKTNFSNLQNLSEEQKQSIMQIKMNRRYETVKKLMEEEKIWKDPDLTAQTICDRINIGKTILTQVISECYGMPFRELVNKYRIEEAKIFMQTNPNATQDTVAEQCGFKNAQYFNTQFKKITGQTPIMWKVNHPSKD